MHHSLSLFFILYLCILFVCVKLPGLKWELRTTVLYFSAVIHAIQAYHNVIVVLSGRGVGKNGSTVAVRSIFLKRIC